MSTLVDAPARVDGVQLIGEMVGSGYRTPPALVRRSDGQVLQLTPLLYLVLTAVDGRRSHAEIADVVGQALGRTMTEDQVRSLVDGHLRPLGLLQREDGSEPEFRRTDPLLRLKPRVAVTDPRTTRRLTDPFRVLFAPAIVAAFVLGFVAVVVWVFFERGLGASAYDAFERPHLLLLVFVVTVLSGGFHEFGHAAAARYSGAKPGAMGLGLYLVWPAFYTDVTDSYRLGRAGRIRTDLGGLYFNAIVAVLTFVWWWATGWEALLLLVATQVLQMVQQLLPLLRFDGYHVLADLAGVPDLYHRIRPTLLGLLPHRWNLPEHRVLTPRARVLITVWVLVTVPMMALMLLGVIGAVPRLLGSADAVIRQDVIAGTSAWSDGNALDVVSHALQVLSVLLPALACVLVLCRVGTRSFRGLTLWSRGSGAKRLVAALVSTAVVTCLSWAWWPHPGNYRPIQQDERGLLASFLPGIDSGPDELARPPAADAVEPSAPPAGAAADQRLTENGPLVAAFEQDAPLPTKAHPSLALVLLPAVGAGGHPSTGASNPDGRSDAEPWVFPFDKPLPADAGDNQALAVNTTDDSVVYDVAFALVWAQDDEVLNVNEAHAYASCTDCVAVAVAFQVVLIMDDARVVVPQNLAVAANYDCQRCITAAIASQLVLSVQNQPGQEQLQALSEVWNQLLQLANTITSYSLTEISAQLETFKDQIVTILDSAPPLGSSPGSSPSPTTDPGEASGDAPSSPTEPPPPTSEPTTSAPTPTPSPDTSDPPSPTGSTTAPAPTEDATIVSPSPSAP